MVNTEALSAFQTVYETPNTFPQENITAVALLLNLQQGMTKCHLQKVLKVNWINESHRLFIYVLFTAWERQ